MNNGSVSIQMLYPGLTFALFAVVFLFLLGYFSGGIGLWLSHKPVFANKIRFGKKPEVSIKRYYPEAINNLKKISI